MVRNRIVQEWLKRYPSFKPEMIFDVGANNGSSVKEFRGAYPEAEIYSFEPVPATYDLLESSTQGDNLTKTFNLALGAQTGSIRMLTGKRSAANRVVEGPARGDTIDVKIVAGDEFCKDAGIARIDFLKIDTEGHDLAVLVGFSEMLRAGAIEYVQAEVSVCPENGYHVPMERVAAFLMPFGYRLFRLVSPMGRLSKHPTRRGAYYCDVVYVYEGGNI